MVGSDMSEDIKNTQVEGFVINGININVKNSTSLKLDLNEKIKNRSGFFSLGTINPEIVISADKFLGYSSVLNRNLYNTVDGVGIQVAGLLRAQVFFRRVCGSDLIHDLLFMANRERCAVGLVGGSERSLDKALINIRSRYPNLSVKGLCPSFSSVAEAKLKSSENDKIMRFFESNRIEIAIICLGAPKQEFWIDANRDQLASLGVVIAAGLGGTVDFLSGEISRAPKLLRLLGLEWFYRLLLQPHRWKRQFNTFPVFLSKLFFSKDFVKKRSFN